MFGGGLAKVIDVVRLADGCDHCLHLAERVVLADANGVGFFKFEDQSAIILMGTEMLALPVKLPKGELKEWERNLLVPIDQLLGNIAHEIIHIQQKYDVDTLLEKTIEEGSADFLCELISGQKLDSAAYRYGLQHEHQLWKEFQQEMNGKDIGHWLYNSVGSKDRPADLGYFVGYQIVKS